MLEKRPFISLSRFDFKNYFQKDFLSGFLVFLIALPLSLGIAMASGFPAMGGIIAAIIGGIVVSFFTGSYLTICGPAAGLIVVVLNAVDKLGHGDVFLGYRMTLAAIFLAGFFQILFGFFKSGKLASYFPSAAVHGMMAAIGIIIMSKQLFTMFGAKPESKEIIDIIKEIPFMFKSMNPKIVLIGISSLLMLIFIPKVNNKFIKKIPAPMIVVLFGIFFHKLLGLDVEHAYNIFDSIFNVGPKYLVQLPKNINDGIVFPDFSGLFTLDFWTVTITLTLVAALESILSMTAIQSIDPQKRKVDFDKDLMALGFGTMISGLLGGLPMIAEIVRSSSNVNNGGKSPWANFWHGLILLFFILVFPKLLQQIPLASLAAILVFVGFRLANPKEFKHMYEIGFDQFLVFIITIFVTLKTDLLIGVGTGIVAEIFVNMIRGLKAGEVFLTNIKMYHLEKPGHDVLIVLRNGATFWNLFKLKHCINRVPNDRNLTLDLARAKVIDHTTMEYLESLEKEFIQKKKTLVIRGLEGTHKFTDYHSSARTRI